MALNIKNSEVESLAAEVAKMAGESKTEAVRKALAERKERLAKASGRQDRIVRIMRFLEHQVWPWIPKSYRGRRPSREEEDAILGYGPDGV